MPRTPLRTLAPALAFAALAVAAGAARSQDLVRSVVVGVDSAGRIVPGSRANQRLWADTAANAIRRSHLDGSGAEELATGLHTPYGLSLDPASGLLLWTSAEDEIVQALPASGGAVSPLPSEFEAPYTLIAHGEGFQTAYAVLDGALVRVTRYDESEEESMETLLPYDGAAPEIHGLALDSSRGVLYLGDANGQMTRRLEIAERRLDRLAFVDETFPTSGPTEPPAGSVKRKGGSR